MFCVAVWPRYWVRKVRRAFARQILAIGFESVGFVSGVAVFVGIAVVVQLAFWVGEAEQSQLLGPLLVTVVARELGPVLINIVVIVRCGSAMATELGILKIGGRIHVLEAQGIAPFIYLVMPRVLGAAVSTFCLTVIFILIALADEAQKLLARANEAMSELQGMMTNLSVAVKNGQAGTTRLPEITDAVADEAKDLPGLVQQTQTSMGELERLIEAMQRHWLLRKYVNQTNPPRLHRLPETAAPEKKPLKVLPSPKDSAN